MTQLVALSTGVAKEVKDVSQFYGQELNRTTYNPVRMNMIMHDVHYQKFDIKQEDTWKNLSTLI